MALRAVDATITTKRLVLNPLRVEDADEMVSVLSDASLYEFTGGHPPTLEELRRRYAVWAEGSGSDTEQWLNWVVRRKIAGRAVGTVQATVIDGGATAMVAWTIGAPWQGRGFAGEAAVGLVEWLVECGVDTVIAHVNADHRASAAVAARAGLRQTGEVVDGEVVWRLGAGPAET